ncbi:MAG TPA: VOC family protein [Verrucomicrobiae bacterium]|nr:VOC family protein [Verrucomicrobiae bacterium]
MLRPAHLSLGVSDTAISERFYRDVLGLPTQRAGEEIVVRWPDFLLVLAPRPPAGRGKFHFGFRVETADEVDRWAERLRANGAENVSGPFTDNGERQVYFIDPDDYEIEIYAPAE